MNFRRSFPAIIVAILAPAAVFSATATDVLRRAEVADRYVSYRGVKSATVSLGCRTATAILKTIHLKPDKTRTEYFSPAPLAGVILIDNGEEVWKYDPREEAWEPMFTRVRPPMEAISRQAARNYDIRLVGTDEVAGREVYVIHADPKREGESARRLWIDREFYLIVGTQVESPSGKIVNSARFTRVEFNPDDISPSIFKPSGKIKSVSASTGPTKFAVAKPTYLPDGYRLVSLSRVNVNGCSSTLLQFSNGINTVSLFQQKANGKTRPKQFKGGLMNVIAWNRSDMHFTLMGDLPRPDLKKIADSVR
jgi:outer membrane lipoprotein-sorting protein